MRIVSFNVENFFARPRAMNQDTWAQGRPVLEAHAEVNRLLEEPSYSPSAVLAWRPDNPSLIEARASQLIDNHDGDRGAVRRAWEQARQGDYDRYYYDEEVARTALKIMDSRARLSMAPGYLNGD